MSSEHQICSRCIMSSKIHDISFNEKGHCNYCEEFINKLRKKKLSDSEHEAKKNSFISKVKKSGENKSYDCIVGVSGGVDSSFALVKAVENGLKPLAVHMDNGWNSELAQSNIENLVRIMNLKYGPYLKDRLFYLESQVDGDISCVDVTLKNSEQTFVYPVSSRMMYKNQQLSARESAMLMLDFVDSYFEDFLKKDEAVYFPIDWTHYTTTDGLSGNWVIDVVPQDIGGANRIWLISWDLVSPVTPHGLTYTDDYGATWNIVNQFNNPEDGGSDSAIVYNLFYDNNEMYAATDKGLYYSTLGNEQSWSSYPIPEDCFEDTEKVYTYVKEGNLEFVGTPNGLIYTCSVNQCGNGWCNEEYVEDNIHSDLGVYPNPASNYTNFIFPVANLRSNLTGSVDVFNFAMEQVKSNVSCFNDGENLKCDYDNINLSNGVYFCRLTYGNKEVWGKLMIIN